MGRPDVWNKEKKDSAIEIVLDKISDGNSLRSILNDNRDKELLPSRKTFNEWLCKDSILSDQYAQACEERAEALLDEMINIVDDSSNDQIDTDLGDGIVASRLNSEAIQRSRLRYDARKWLISKLNPKKYGDKIDMTTQGEKIGESSPEEKAFRLAEILKKVNTK